MGLRLNEPQYSGSLMIFEFVKEYYSKHKFILPDDAFFRLKDVYEYKFAFEHKFRLGPAIRMGLSYKTPMINFLNPLTNFTLVVARVLH